MFRAPAMLTTERVQWLMDSNQKHLCLLSLQKCNTVCTYCTMQMVYRYVNCVSQHCLSQYPFRSHCISTVLAQGLLDVKTQLSQIKNTTVLLFWHYFILMHYIICPYFHFFAKTEFPAASNNGAWLFIENIIRWKQHIVSYLHFVFVCADFCSEGSN